MVDCQKIARMIKSNTRTIVRWLEQQVEKLQNNGFNNRSVADMISTTIATQWMVSQDDKHETVDEQKDSKVKEYLVRQIKMIQ